MPQRGVTTYPTVIGIRLTADQAAQLRQIAAKDDRAPGALARRIIATHLAKRTAETQDQEDIVT